MQLLARICLSLLLMLSVACSERKVARQQHEAETGPAPQQLQKAEAQDSRLDSLRQQLSEGKTVKPEEVASLAAEVLSIEDLSQPAFQAQNLNKKKLIILNELLVNNQGTSDLLKKYVSTLTYGCTETLQECWFIDFFKKDSLSSKVLQKAALSENNLMQKYRLLMLAYEIKGIAADVELDNLYADQAAEYEKLLEGQAELVTRHHRILGLIMKLQKDRGEQSAWLKNHRAWEVTKSDNSAITQDMELLLGLLAKNHLYQDKSGRKITQALMNAINKTQAQLGSFSQRQDVLFQKFSRMARNLDLKKVDSNSEIFFIVDRVFAEAINPKDLSPLIKNSRFSAHELDEIARRYVEMELALLIRNVNESLSKNLKGNTTTTANLISDAKDHSRQLYVQIMNFLRKADLVHNLVKFVSQYKSQEIQKKTKDFFEGMRSHLKFSITYPQMMALSYHYAKGSYKNTLDSINLLGSLFNGKERPWFQYGHDNIRLTRLEVLVAFELALKTEVFEAFDVQPQEFLKEIFSKLVVLKAQRLDLSLQMLELKYNDSNWKTMQMICHYLPKPPQVPMQIHIDDLRDSPLGNMTPMAFASGANLGNLDNVTNLSALKPSFFLYNRQISRTFEEIRLGHRPFFRYADSLLKIYQNFMMSEGKNQEEIDANLVTAREPLAKLQKTEQVFMNTFAGYKRIFDSCFSNYSQYDKNLQLKLIAYEQAYFEQVHAYMSTIQKQPSLKESLNKKAKVYSVGSIEGNSSFDGQTYSNYMGDVFLRYKMYFEKGLKTDKVELPAINPYIEILVPQVADNSQVLRDKLVLHISWNESAKEFSRQALTYLSDTQNSNLIKWYTTLYYDAGGANRDGRYWQSVNSMIYLMSDAGLPTDLKVEASDLVKTPAEAVKYLGITDLENQWMNFIGIMDKFRAMSIMEDYLLHSESKLPMAPYNYLLMILSEDYMGQYDNREYVLPSDGPVKAVAERPAELIPPFVEVKDYFQFLTNSYQRGFVFSAGKIIVADLDKTYKKQIQDHQSKLNAVVQAIKDKYEQDLKTNQVLKPRYRPNQEYHGPYYHISREKELESRLLNFHEDTKNYFKN